MTILAVVLGPLLESALRQSLILSSGSLAVFVTRPLSALLFAVAVVLLVLPLFIRRYPAVGITED